MKRWHIIPSRYLHQRGTERPSCCASRLSLLVRQVVSFWRLRGGTRSSTRGSPWRTGCHGWSRTWCTRVRSWPLPLLRSPTLARSLGLLARTSLTIGCCCCRPSPAGTTATPTTAHTHTHTSPARTNECRRGCDFHAQVRFVCTAPIQTVAELAMPSRAPPNSPTPTTHTSSEPACARVLTVACVVVARVGPTGWQVARAPPPRRPPSARAIRRRPRPPPPQPAAARPPQPPQHPHPPPRRRWPAPARTRRAARTRTSMTSGSSSSSVSRARRRGGGAGGRERAKSVRLAGRA